MTPESELVEVTQADRDLYERLRGWTPDARDMAGLTAIARHRAAALTAHADEIARLRAQNERWSRAIKCEAIGIDHGRTVVIEFSDDRSGKKGAFDLFNDLMDRARGHLTALADRGGDR